MRQLWVYNFGFTTVLMDLPLCAYGMSVLLEGSPMKIILCFLEYLARKQPKAEEIIVQTVRPRGTHWRSVNWHELSVHERRPLFSDLASFPRSNHRQDGISIQSAYSRWAAIHARWRYTWDYPMSYRNLPGWDRCLQLWCSDHLFIDGGAIWIGWYLHIVKHSSWQFSGIIWVLPSIYCIINLIN